MHDGILHKEYANQRLSKRYLQFRYQERALAAASVIREHLGRSGPLELVDFGAAEGLTLIELARLCGPGQYTGIEFDHELIKSAPPLPEGVQLMQGDVARTPLRDGFADAVTALALLEHLEHPERALREAGRLLKPGGVFVATSPVPFWDRATEFLHRKKGVDVQAHLTDMNERTVRRMADAAGLTFVAYFKFMLAPIGFLPYLNVAVPPTLAWNIDTLLQKMHLFEWLYVNQCFVLQKSRSFVRQ